MLFDNVLQHTVRKVQEIGGLKPNGTHLLMVSADDVNLLAKTIHSIKMKTEVLLVAIEEVDVEKIHGKLYRDIRLHCY